MDKEMVMDTRKDAARDMRRDMIKLLNNIISESEKLKDQLKKLQNIDNFTHKATTDDVAYNVLSKDILSLVKTESSYNILIEQIAVDTSLSKENNEK
ncbi:hypothetical protein [Selenomonas ruminantium]|uniref:hypothetical protein n=1 Tax=Selenomonas ruminantium TaxID=971 RepID=UPI0026EA93A6|nr:hypothetical protein [Selenomonas ruminantium]